MALVGQNEAILSVKVSVTIAVKVSVPISTMMNFDGDGNRDGMCKMYPLAWATSKKNENAPSYLAISMKTKAQQ